MPRVRSEEQLQFALNAPPRPQWEDAGGDKARWRELQHDWVAAWRGRLLERPASEKCMVGVVEAVKEAAQGAAEDRRVECECECECECQYHKWQASGPHCWTAVRDDSVAAAACAADPEPELFI